MHPETKSPLCRANIYDNADNWVGTCTKRSPRCHLVKRTVGRYVSATLACLLDYWVYNWLFTLVYTYMHTYNMYETR